MANRFKVLSSRIENEGKAALEEKTLQEEADRADFDLILDGKGRPEQDIANAIMVLTNDPAFRDVFSYDTLAHQRIVNKAIPGEKRTGFPRPLEDYDYTAVQVYLNYNGFPSIAKNVVVDAVCKVCRDNSFDPLEEYLRGLKWDGVERLPDVLPTYFSAQQSEYVSEVGLRWMISGAARGLTPGCKADYMLVLEGPQGLKKSTGLATLAGDSWFSDCLPEMFTKDAQMHLRGHWIIEVAELESMVRRPEKAKAFLTTQIERYRPTYGRENVVEPRRCIFAGTTNRADWQPDETGGRRFWPVKVGAIDLEGLARDRDQLWAEAVARFQRGEKWHLDGEVEQIALKEASARRPEDPWRSEIADLIDGLHEVTTKAILTEMGIASVDMTPALSKRVAKELVSLGWENGGRITSGAFKGAARYVPTAPTA
ncbi:VapE domain-containing protein [Sulfitobacter pontiacus]|uniref:VapE domain-containing protein n=1 Tax=Sulfitobacter pontiacus TaxID=60137 RepID=UPI0030EB9846